MSETWLTAPTVLERWAAFRGGLDLRASASLEAEHKTVHQNGEAPLEAPPGPWDDTEANERFRRILDPEGLLWG